MNTKPTKMDLLVLRKAAKLGSLRQGWCSYDSTDRVHYKSAERLAKLGWLSPKEGSSRLYLTHAGRQVLRDNPLSARRWW